MCKSARRATKKVHSQRTSPAAIAQAMTKTQPPRAAAPIATGARTKADAARRASTVVRIPGRDRSRPGLLVPPDDPAALGEALRAWLADADLRRRLRRAAGERRESLADWSTTTSALADVLARAA